MNIIYLSNALPRPWESGGARPWREVAFLAGAGHAVTVITNQRHYLTDEVPPAARGKLVYATREEGIDILGVATLPRRRKSMLLRILNYINFALMAFYAGLKAPKPDLIYVRTPPILIPFTGWLLAQLKRSRLVIYIGDLHPEEAVSLGLIKSLPAISLWEKLENFFRRRADLIVTAVPGIYRLLVDKGYKTESIYLSTNPYEPLEERMEPLPEDTARVLDSLNGRFIIMYTGTVGLSHAMEVGIDAAALIQQAHPEINFVIVGQGDKIPLLKKRAAEKNLQNITFLDPVPRNSMGTLLNRAQAVMHLVYPGKMHGCYYFPNKLFEYLGAGKPFLYSGDGDIAHLIREARCGLVTPPEDAQAFAGAVDYLFKHQKEGQQMGRRAREYVQLHYDRQNIMAGFVKALEGLQIEKG